MNYSISCAFSRVVLGSAVLVSSVVAWSEAATLVQFEGVNVLVEDTLGTGSKQAVVFADWSESKGGHAQNQHAWLVRWNDDELATLADALSFVAAETSAADEANFFYEGGASVLDDFQVVTATETKRGDEIFWASSWASFDDGTQFAGPATVNDNGVVMYSLGTGLTGAELKPGAFYGINPDLTEPGQAAADDFPGSAPSFRGGVVPEPGVLGLFALGAMVLGRRRRLVSCA